MGDYSDFDWDSEDPDPATNPATPQRKFDWRKALTAGAAGLQGLGAQSLLYGQVVPAQDAWTSLGTAIGSGMKKVVPRRNGGPLIGPVEGLVGEAGPEEILRDNEPPEFVTRPKIETLGAHERAVVRPLTRGPHKLTSAGEMFMRSHGIDKRGRVHRFAEGAEVDPWEPPPMEPLNEPDPNAEIAPGYGAPPPPEPVINNTTAPGYGEPPPPPPAKTIEPPPAMNPVLPAQPPPSKLDQLRAQREALKVPVRKDASTWRKIAAAAVGAVGGIANANPHARPIDLSAIEDEIKHPGYAKEVERYNAAKADQDRAIALEDKAFDQKVKEATLRNTEAGTTSLISQRKASEENQREQRYENVRKRGGEEIPAGQALTPQEVGRYTIESVEGKRFKVPTKAELARQQRAAIQDTWEELPAPVAAGLRIAPGTRVPPESIPHYLNAYTQAQKEENKTLDQQVNERTKIADKLKMNPRDREVYIATGRIERPPVNNFNIGSTDAPSSMAQMVADYEIPYAQAVARMPAQARENLTKQIHSINPQFLASNYDNFKRTEQDASTGKIGTTSNAINTMMGHLTVLDQAADALKNNDVQLLNKIANAWGIQTGGSAVTKFKAIVNRVGPETVRAYVGSGGDVSDRQKMESDFSPNMSPDQIKTNIRIAAQLAAGKMHANQDQYMRGTYGRGKQKLLSDEAEASLSRFMAPSGGGSGMITVQIPGHQPSQIPANKKAEFLRDHPDGKVF